VDHVRLLLKRVGRELADERDVAGRTCIHWAVRRTEPLHCLQVSLATRL